MARPKFSSRTQAGWMARVLFFSFGFLLCHLIGIVRRKGGVELAQVASEAAKAVTQEVAAPVYPLHLPPWCHGAAASCTWPNTTAPIDPLLGRHQGFLLNSASGQGKEDLYLLEHFFWNKADGVYLELGALDGVLISNTQMLHNLLAWRGVLIEANPATYAKLARNRQDDVCMNAAVCAKLGIVHAVLNGVPEMSGIYEFMPESFRKKWHPQLDNIPLESLPEVHCVPLSLILQQANVRHLDWFSLDVEGGELEVLKSLDFSAVSIDVLTVEADETNPAKNDAVAQLLAAAGYQAHGHVGNNDWFVHSSFVPSTKPTAA